MGAVTAAPGRSPDRPMRGARGQALVEFALVAPMFLVLLVAIFDFGRVVWSRNALENAAREGARYAIVHGGSRTTACPVGPDALGRSDVAECVGGSPATTSAKQVARDWAFVPSDNLTVTICYGADCIDDTSTDTNRPGNPVTVRTSTTIGLSVAPLFRLFDADFGIIRLDAAITMLVNT